MGCVTRRAMLWAQGRGVPLRSQTQHHLAYTLSRRLLTSCIDLQIANINFVLMSRNLEDSGKHSPGHAEAHKRAS